MGRKPCCEKVGLKRGKWTAAEDGILISYILAHGEGSWRTLPKNAGLLRCGKSCRLRWMNYLRSDLKRGNITKEEEELIIKLHATLGNRWSLIAGHLPGRTDNEIKNYWHSHLARKLLPAAKPMTSTADRLPPPGAVKPQNNRPKSTRRKYTTKMKPSIRSRGGSSSLEEETAQLLPAMIDLEEETCWDDLFTEAGLDFENISPAGNSVTTTEFGYDSDQVSDVVSWLLDVEDYGGSGTTGSGNSDMTGDMVAWLLS